MLSITDTCAANTNEVTQKLRIRCNFLLSWPTAYIYSNHSSFFSFKENVTKLVNFKFNPIIPFTVLFFLSKKMSQN